MQVSTIIDYAAKGDLKQISLSNIGTKESRTNDQQENLDTLVGFVNQGILELYKRFPIKINVDDNTVFAPSTVEDSIQLPDTALELMKVTKTDGTEVPVDNYDVENLFKLNLYKDVYVKSLSVNNFLILGEMSSTGTTVQFHYKSAPEQVRYNSMLPLPVMYQEALMNYVAYRGYSTVKSVTPVGDEGFNYKKRFEDSCLRIEQNTDTLYEWANPKRLYERGFI